MEYAASLLCPQRQATLWTAGQSLPTFSRPMPCMEQRVLCTARHQLGAGGGDAAAAAGFMRSFSLIFCIGGPSYARLGGAGGGLPPAFC